MKVKHPLFLAVLLCLGLSTLSPSASLAQRYPDRPIQLVIPNPAGAIADITARILADDLGKILGEKIVPNNKPGASSVLGVESVVKGKKDGYTLVYANTSSLIYVPVTNPEVVPYNPGKDLEPLGFHYWLPPTVNVKADSQWKTFGELIDYARKHPWKLRIGTVGIGSISHFAVEMIQAMTGAQFTHVPFKGGESTVMAVLGGHVEVSCDAFSKVKPLLDTGEIRILLTTNKIPAYPQIPTITELGYKQSLPTSWFGIYGPAGIPEEAKRVLVPAIEKAVRNTSPKITKLMGVCEYKSPEELKKMWEEEYKNAYEIAVKLGLRKSH